MFKSYLNKTGKYGSIIPAARRRWEMVIEPLPNANAAAKFLLKNPQRVKKSTEKVGPFGALVNLRLRRWDTSSGASVLLRYGLNVFSLL